MATVPTLQEMLEDADDFSGGELRRRIERAGANFDPVSGDVLVQCTPGGEFSRPRVVGWVDGRVVYDSDTPKLARVNKGERPTEYVDLRPCAISGGHAADAWVYFKHAPEGGE